MARLIKQISSQEASPAATKHAISGPHALHWQTATTKEITMLLANGTWEIVDLPLGAKAIPSGWVFKVMRHADGTIERYKGRLVAKGYSQRPGIDYENTSNCEIWGPPHSSLVLKSPGTASIALFHSLNASTSSTCLTAMVWLSVIRLEHL